MKTVASAPTVRLRALWIARLAAVALRSHRLANALGGLAFAAATLALFAAGAYLAAERGGPVRPESAAATSAGADDVALVAFLRDDLPLSSRDVLAAALRQLPGVAGVRLLRSDQALARLRQELGQRAAVLDGVEEGFLPATLEVGLRSGPDGSQRADAIAWRLKRMEGITEVDVLRSAADQRWAQSELMSRRLGQAGLVLALVAAVSALLLGGVALRRRRGDGALLTDLGFTPGAVALPGAVAGAICAAGGGLLAVAVAALTVRLVAQPSAIVGGWMPAVSVGSGTWLLGLGVVLICGAGLGWWGARPSEADAHEVEAGA